MVIAYKRPRMIWVLSCVVGDRLKVITFEEDACRRSLSHNKRCNRGESHILEYSDIYVLKVDVKKEDNARQQRQKVVRLLSTDKAERQK